MPISSAFKLPLRYLTVVLADGAAVEVGGPRSKDVAGYVDQAVRRQRGTLGVTTEIMLKLIPAQRRAHTLGASFPTLDAATGTVLAISRTMRPSMLECMDNASINAVEDLTNMAALDPAGILGPGVIFQRLRHRLTAGVCR